MTETDLIIMRYRQILAWLLPALVAIVAIILLALLRAGDRHRRGRPPRERK